MEDEFFDPLKKKERWHCDKHNVMIAGKECPLCKAEKKYVSVKIETPHRKRWKWHEKKISQPIGTSIKMIHMLDQSLSI